MQEICSLDLQSLPLQQGLRYSSTVVPDSLSVSVLKTACDQHHFSLMRVFYIGIVAGRNCADDPMPADGINEYCEVSICINKTTALTTTNLTRQAKLMDIFIL